MAIGKYITSENAAYTIAGHNIVIDALDSVSARLLLEDACAQADIPLISFSYRRDYAFGALKAMPGVELEMPHGAFYLLDSISAGHFLHSLPSFFSASAILRSAAMYRGGKAAYRKAGIRQ